LPLLRQRYNRIGVGQPRSKTPQGNIFPPGTGLKSRRLFSRHNLAQVAHASFSLQNTTASRISTSPAVGLTAPNACIETPNPKLCQLGHSANKLLLLAQIYFFQARSPLFSVESIYVTFSLVVRTLIFRNEGEKQIPKKETPVA
jgi:hypothetical protein